MIDLYKNIKERRLELHLSQDELANLTGYNDRSSITKIEQGLVDLSLSKVELFANALKTTPAKLMGWVDKTVEIPENKSVEIECEISREELDQIKAIAELVIKKDNISIVPVSKKYNKHFTEVKDAMDYLKSVKQISAFYGGLQDYKPESILAIANAIWSEENEKIKK